MNLLVDIKQRKPSRILRTNDPQKKEEDSKRPSRLSCTSRALKQKKISNKKELRFRRKIGDKVK